MFVVKCGCPIDLVFKMGAGSALPGRKQKYEKIVRGMASVMDIPLTVKLRTGIEKDKKTAHELLPQLKTWGVQMITVCDGALPVWFFVCACVCM